jgi:hypothetical protein
MLLLARGLIVADFADGAETEFCGNVTPGFSETPLKHDRRS